MKIAPTLADGMLRETFKPKLRTLDRTGSFRNALLRARRFVLDDQMSAFMADLCYGGLSRNDDRNFRLLENMRKSARLPHPITWIEFNMLERRKRVLAAYHSATRLVKSPTRAGWLLEQHPDIDTAFRATECCSSDEPEPNHLDPTPNVISWTWMADDRPLPWSNILNKITGVQSQQITEDGRDGKINGFFDCEISEGATGLENYHTNQVGIINSHFRALREESIMELARECCGELRYIWSLLSTINDIPVVNTHVTSTTGFVARGAYRKCMDHSVITLRVPGHKTMRDFARVINRAARRRGHMVRGHFRKDHWRTGGKIWVHEHERGNRSLGWVTHDYMVTRDEQKNL